MKKAFCVLIVLITILSIIPFNVFAREPVDVDPHHKHTWGEEYTKSSNKSPEAYNDQYHKVFSELWHKCTDPTCGLEKKIKDTYVLNEHNKNSSITTWLNEYTFDNSFHYQKGLKNKMCTCGKLSSDKPTKVTKKGTHKYNKNGQFVVNGNFIFKTDGYCICGKRNPKYKDLKTK